MSDPTVVTGTSVAGGRVYAVIDPSVDSGRRGVLAHSAAIAALMPFATREQAIAAFERIGIVDIKADG